MQVFDKDLGEKIYLMLRAKGLENEVNFAKIKLWGDSSYQLQLQHAVTNFLDTLGLHLNPLNTPITAQRLARFFTAERFCGLNYHKFPAISTTENLYNYTNPVIASGVEFNTTCEHHFLGIRGKALLAYIPGQQIVGLNKLNQVLNFFSHRPQLQERLTCQVYATLCEVLQTDNVAVILNARHDCISSGGTIDYNSHHTTYQLGGSFASDPELKNHVLNHMLTVPSATLNNPRIKAIE
jgi:GTP cyclohydrolase I